MEKTGTEALGHKAPLTAASLVTLSLMMTLGISAMLLFSQGSADQTFSAAGASRRVVLPLVYLVMGCIIVRVSFTQRFRAGPAFLWIPLVAGTLSFAVNLDAFLHNGVPINAVQGFLLLGGFTLVGVAGVSTGRWTEPDRRLLMPVIVVAALVAVSLPVPDLSLTPYSALVIPAVYAALLSALKGRKHRLLWLVLAIAVAALGTRALRPAPGMPISIAVLGQIAVGAAIVVLVLMPRQVRAATLVVGAIVTVGLLLSPPVLSYLTGHYTGDDVTLAQRAYEADQVQKTVTDTAAGPVVGRGPAATVDLTSSPDRDTLLTSGRDLPRVDDVHLVTAYLLLKLGLIGLAWLVWLLAVTYRFIWRELCVQHVDIWRVCLLLFLLCGLVSAFPAATELLSNPLVPLFLGILWADALPRGPRGDSPHHRTSSSSPSTAPPRVSTV